MPRECPSRALSAQAACWQASLTAGKPFVQAGLRQAIKKEEDCAFVPPVPPAFISRRLWPAEGSLAAASATACLPTGSPAVCEAQKAYAKSAAALAASSDARCHNLTRPFSGPPNPYFDFCDPCLTGRMQRVDEGLMLVSQA